MEGVDFKKGQYDLNAEYGVIGSLLIKNELIPYAIEKVSPSTFFEERNAILYSNIIDIYEKDKKVDSITLLDKVTGDKDNITKHLMDIMTITTTSAFLESYIEIVLEKSRLRKLLNIADEIYKNVYDENLNSEDIADKLEINISNIDNYASGINKTLVNIDEIVPKVYNKLEEKNKNKGQITGLSTGFVDLDNMIMGLNKTDLILVGARPAMGKTSFVMNIATNVAKSTDKKIVIYQLEMDEQQLVTKMIGYESGTKLQKLKTGDLEDSEWENIVDAGISLSNTGIMISDKASITVKEMKNECRKIKDLGLIVIDYLQLIQPSKTNSNKSVEVGEISRDLKIMAKELGVPVVCLSQLSRNVEHRTDKTPIMSDLRDSGSIEADCDVILLLHREEYYDPQTERKNIADVIIAKNRQGPTGIINLAWFGEYTLFTNLHKG